MLQLSPRLRDGMARMKLAATGKADCIPVYAQMSHHSAKLAGESTRRFFTDAQTFVRCQLHADDFYQLDSPTIHYDCYNIEAEAMGAPLLWEPDQCPEVDPARPLLSSAGACKSLARIRMGEAGRMPFVLEMNRILADLGVPPKPRFCGVFTLAAKLMGFERLLEALIVEPDAVHGLMTFLTDEVLAPWIACQRERCGCNETATGADALASPPVLAPPLIEEFCLAYVRRLERLVGKIRLAGLWGERHLREPRALLDIKRAGCPTQLQALDPDVTALGPDCFKRYADETGMAVVMGIDATLIESGPAGDLEARARRFIDAAARDGRFVLYMNDVPFDAPPEHVHAVVRVGHQHRY